MLAHLKQAVDKYNDTDRDLHIHPVSKEDAEIIGEIIELLKKMNFVAAIDILKNYKKVSDEDIYLDLLDLNTQIGKVKGSVENQENQVPLFQRYLLTCGRRLDVYLIVSYDAIDVEFEDGSIRHCIKINPTPKEAKQIPYYSNEILVYENEKERDEILSKLDAHMVLYRGLFLK